MSTTTECRIDQLGCVLHGFRDPKCKFFNYDDEPPAPRAGERDDWRILETVTRTSVVNEHGENVAVGMGRGAKQRREHAEQIVAEHNQHATLIGQRERLLATLKLVTASYVKSNDNGIAARKARELIATIEREGV